MPCYWKISQKTYMCGDYNIDLLKVNDLKFNEEYFHDILSAGYIPGLAVSSAKRKLPEETAEEMEGKKHFLPWKKWKKRKK